MKSSREVGRKVSPPQPVFMSDDQKSDYLSSLRNNRPARPVGSRPLPSKAASTPSPTKDSLPPRAESALALRPQNVEPMTAVPELDPSPRCASALSFNQRDGPSTFDSSVKSKTSIGRPLAAVPGQQSYSIRGRKVSPTAVVEVPLRSPSGNYRESGARWLERQEAISIREALEEMDHQSEEKRIHAAAQDEAADLVWRHRNPKAEEEEKNAAYANPDIQAERKHRFTAHLQKDAYSRSQRITNDVSRPTIPKSASMGSSSINSIAPTKSKEIGEVNVKKATDQERAAEAAPEDHLTSKPVADGTNQAKVRFGARKSSRQRKVSNGSGKGSFPLQDDKIHEDSRSSPVQDEPTMTLVSTTPGPLTSMSRNSQLRGSRPLPGRPTENREKVQCVDRFEIYKNPPTQSRSAGYTNNANSPVVEIVPEVETSPGKNGIEIRSGDIRAATTMKLKDRSPKLPLPTAVSDRPGRPIVSFDPRWKPDNLSGQDIEEPGRPGPRPLASLPIMTVSAPAVPTINVSGLEESSIPTIITPNDESVPAITVIAEESSSTATAMQSPTARPLPQPSKTMPGKVPTAKTSSRLPWLNPSSRTGVPTATCANCALPISGRVVTASGAGASSSTLKARFHPECFTCHHCSTALECVAFYPEPEDKRTKRLEAEGFSNQDVESELRFYCHLDFHEFFSPRCRSCETPIEGEVIVAAGAEWHVGHFFCSECGDPFDSSTPFVEKDNYAYCVSCHTRRTSARCRACKNQILDEMTVQALGGQWHADCFNCYECGGSFGEDGRFFVRDVTVEGTEKEKRRGIASKKEERAVCEACEGRRLKA